MDRLGRYRLVRRLGEGGMAEVWEAADEGLRRRVAVKILRPPTEDRALAEARFTREAQAAAALRHPNVVVVHDVGEAEGVRYLVMELVDGKSLREMIGQAATDRVRWIREIAAALAAMHAEGIVHRDVKPENVIVRSDGSACLVDLGIAKFEDEARAATLDASNVARTEENVVVGTPDYLPPEARTTAVYDALGDQWAWGTLAYELLTGVHPRDVGERPLTGRADFPAAIAAAIDRARSPQRSERFGSMADVSLAIAKTTRLAREAPAKRTPLAIAFVSAAAVLALGGAGFALALHSRPVASAPVASSTASSPSPPPPTASDVVPAAIASDASPAASAPPHLFHVGVIRVVIPPMTSDEAKSFDRRHRPLFQACITKHPPRCPVHLALGCEVTEDFSLQHCHAGRSGVYTIEKVRCDSDALTDCIESSVEFRYSSREYANFGADVYVQ